MFLICSICLNKPGLVAGAVKDAAGSKAAIITFSVCVVCGLSGCVVQFQVDV